VVRAVNTQPRLKKATGNMFELLMKFRIEFKVLVTGTPLQNSFMVGSRAVEARTSHSSACDTT
jgi:hypothetical protein